MPSASVYKPGSRFLQLSSIMEEREIQLVAEKRKVRLTQEERSTKSRETLARTAFELIRKGGYANFRVAAVAKAAGVSQGRQLHHFPNKEAIVCAAAEYGLRLAEDRTKSNLARVHQEDDLIQAIASDSKDYYFSDSFYVSLDITRAASGDRELLKSIRDMTRRYRNFAEQEWRRQLLDRGWSGDDSRDIVELTTALVRGFSIRRMIRSDRASDYDHFIERWAEIVYATIRPAGS